METERSALVASIQYPASFFSPLADLSDFSVIKTTLSLWHCLVSWSHLHATIEV